MELVYQPDLVRFWATFFTANDLIFTLNWRRRISKHTRGMKEKKRATVINYRLPDARCPSKARYSLWRTYLQ